jgi:hypothetical protein
VHIICPASKKTKNISQKALTGIYGRDRMASTYCYATVGMPVIKEGFKVILHHKVWKIYYFGGSV